MNKHTLFEPNQMNKTYDYTQYISGRDYFFEVLNGGITACMTAGGNCPKCGDRILLKYGGKTYQYQIEEIDPTFRTSKCHTLMFQ
jgi:hypothetical protein